MVCCGGPYNGRAPLSGYRRPMESRLAEIEAKLSFAEDLIDSLNTTVYRQQARLDLLESQIRLLHQQIQALQPNEEFRSLRDEIPPHY